MTQKSQLLNMLTKHVTKDALGIEITPFFNPAVPKSEGYNVLILDIQAADGLRDRARESDLIPDERVHEIEDVDIVGDASSTSRLVSDSPYDPGFN
ncbi:MAG: hypothetical protein OXC60_16155 [Litoreibacter sp.]|nr:hypothetical protein [Litoreibacter sp.]